MKRSLLIALMVLALVMASVPAYALSLLNLKNELIQFLLEQISDPEVFEVTVEKVETPEDGGTRLVNLQVTDSSGAWLTMKSAEFDWNPTRLLKGEIEISRIVLESPVLSRLPAPSAATKDEDSATDDSELAWPRSPLALFVRQFAARDVEVKKGVLPQAIRFNATGRVHDEGDEQALTFELSRQDAIDGEITLDYLRDFASETLQLNLEGAEAPGGLVAALSGLPSNVPVQIDLKADGPDRDWSLSLNAAAAGVVSLTGSSAANWRQPLSLDAAFELVPGPKLAEKTRLLLEPAASLQVVAQEDAYGRIFIKQGLLEASQLDASASGWFERGTGEIELETKARLGSGLSVLLEGIAFETITFSGNAKGRLEQLEAQGDLVAKGVITTAASLPQAEVSLAMVREVDRISFDIAGRGENAKIVALGSEPLGIMQFASKGVMEGDLLTLESADFRTHGLQAHLAGSVTTEGVLDVAAELEASRNLAARLDGIDFEGITFAGNVVGPSNEFIAKGEFDIRDFSMASFSIERFEAVGRAAQDARGLGFDLSGRGVGPQVDRLGREILGDIDLAVQGAVTETALDLDLAELVTAAGRLDARGTIPLGEGLLDARYELDVPDIARLAGAYGLMAEGSLGAEGQASGPMAQLSLEGSLAASDTEIDGRRMGQLRLTHNVEVGPTQQGHITMTMTDSLVGDGRIDADFALAEDRLRVASLKGDLADVTLAGDVETDLGTGLSSGGLEVSSLDLSDLGRLLGQALAGAFQGRLDLAASDGRQALSWDIAAQDLSAASVALADMKVKGDAQDLLGTLSLDATAEVAELLAGDAKLVHTEITANGSLTELDLTLSTEGEAAKLPLTVQTQAQIRIQEAVTRIMLSRLEASVAQEPLRLTSPLEIKMAGDVVEIEGLDITLPDNGLIRGKSNLAPEGLTGRIELDSVPLRLAQVFAAAPLDAGTLSGDLTFDTRQESAGASGALRGEGLRLQGVSEDTGVLDVELDMTWDGITAELNSSLTGNFGEPAILTLALPVDPSDGALPQIRSDGELLGTAAWRGEIEPLWALVPVPDHLLTGEATIDLELAGRLSAPKISGGFSLTGGHYQNLTAGTVLTELSLDTTIRDSKKLIVGVSATDGADGKVDGEILLDLLDQGFNIDAEMTSDGAILVRRDDAVARIDAKITIVGSAEELSVAGDITVSEAELRLINRVPPSVVDLGPVQFEEEPEQVEEDDDPGIVALDIRVRAPGQVYIRGRGLESEWAMSLDVTGTAVKPVVVGDITALRGRLDLVGKQFALTKGQILFSGGREIDPALNIVLSREANDLIGRVVFAGYASNPELRFESTPEVPQDEVLPRVVFGRSAQSLSAFEAAQLAAGAARLTSGEAGVIDTIRSSLGLDVMQLDTDADESTSLKVGRYVSDKVFVGARQALDSQGGAAIVELEVIENIILDAELGHEGESSTGLNWRFDF